MSTVLSRGLSRVEVDERLARFGPNRLPAEKAPSIATLIWRQMSSFIVLMLLAAALVSASLGYLSDATAILVALVINAVIGFAMEYRAEQASQALRELTAPMALVRREGAESRIPADQLVPGDLVRLTDGDRIPADGTLLDGRCTVNESLLTGESLPVWKSAAEGADGDRLDRPCPQRSLSPSLRRSASPHERPVPEPDGWSREPGRLGPPFPAGWA